MSVLFVTSEHAELLKAGGLGDISAALPRAMRDDGCDIRILMPAYSAVLAKVRPVTIVAHRKGRGVIPPYLIGATELAGGVPLYLVIAPTLYQRDGSAYGGPDGLDHADNDIRFACLSLAAAEICAGLPRLGWRPDILHAHDWVSGLAPAYVRWWNLPVKTVMTIHNIAHQGLFPYDRGVELGVPPHAFHVDGLEFHLHGSFLKAGIYYSDHLTTVSPTYAREITEEVHGGGLHGLIAGIAGDGRLTGIPNGIGDEWSPARDYYLPQQFDEQSLETKTEIADAIRTAMCLDPSEGPLFGVVSRLVHQKGFDVLAEAADRIIAKGAQIAILGTGDPQVETMLLELSRRHRGKIGLMVGFNEPMAHRIIAAADFFLMPSRFEPCGLTQMQAQRYGTLPVAHATGGLADTIEDGRTGFLFAPLDADTLVETVNRALEVFADKDRLEAMRRVAMAKDFSWRGPAKAYKTLYARLAQEVPKPAVNRPDLKVVPKNRATAKVA